MVERKVLAVCAGVGFLGLLSAALGFTAEAERIKVSDVQATTEGQCLYPKSPALALGLASAVALVLAQAIINTTAGCICCKQHPYSSGSKWSLALISFIFSWMTFIMAFILLLMGSALNDPHGQERIYFGDYCYVVKPGVFSGGAIMSFSSVSLAIIYYLALSSSKNSNDTNGTQQGEGIAMGQPQVPPQATQPVFVHEDTYNRQQFP